MFKIQNCQSWLQLKDDAEFFNGISRKGYSWDLAQTTLHSIYHVMNPENSFGGPL